MGAQGLAEVDFGAFPGVIEKETDVSTAGVVITSLVEAWLVPDETTDHTVDEHIAMMDSLRVQGRYLSDNNIRIRVMPVYPQQTDKLINPNQAPQKQLAYGKWSVGWVWN